MAGPAQSKPTRGYEGTGVPVLFSLKNVQPLLLNSDQKLTTPATQQAIHPPTQPVVMPTQQSTKAPLTPDDSSKQSVRRSSLASRAITAAFLVLLVVVVLRYSIPKQRDNANIAEGTTQTVENQNPEFTAPQSTLKGPTSLVANRSIGGELMPTPASSTPGTSNTPSLPSEGTQLNLESPSIPPMLLTSPAANGQSASSFVSVDRTPTEPLQLGNSTPEFGFPNSPNQFPNSLPQNQLSPNLLPNNSLPQDRPSNGYVPIYGNNATTNPRSNPKLNIVNTPTPETSFSELEMLYRNATQLQAQTPSRTVSSSTPIDNRNPSGVSTPTIPLTGASYPDDRNANAPLSIPEYERSLNNAMQNRYQPIRQPSSPTQPAPYRPVGGSFVPPPTVAPPQPQTGLPTQPQPGTSVGYPPIQYEPK
jgi:hypothetical protein